MCAAFFLITYSVYIHIGTIAGKKMPGSYTVATCRINNNKNHPPTHLLLVSNDLYGCIRTKLSGKEAKLNHASVRLNIWNACKLHACYWTNLTEMDNIGKNVEAEESIKDLVNVH